MPDALPRPMPATRLPGARGERSPGAVLPLLFLLYVIAYLDRANVGFAKLQDERRTRRSPTPSSAWGIGLFFVGYLFLEIPGALLVEHWSARKWFARILVTWGVCSMAMALVRTPGEFYLVRFLLGLAEAGFFPGVIVYFTHWFPQRGPRTGACPAMLDRHAASAWRSGRISRGCSWSRHWFGLTGWQWVFLVEGRRPCCWASRCRFCSPTGRGTRDGSRRKSATGSKRRWRRNAGRPRQSVRCALRDALRLRTVWLLALGIFATNIGGYAFVFWLPTVVKGLLAGDRARRERPERAELVGAGLPVRAGGRPRLGLVVGPHRRPEVALRRGAARDGRCSSRSALSPGSRGGSCSRGCAWPGSSRTSGSRRSGCCRP